ncbi:ENTH-domain-containing protein [Microstroma glucosiphilum]|uniref:ENTH-domain-containing protein n=1 Tax=Pseudomicrostroma glucosiphilum TaxID=1684307 RepID=A0A316U088_9BASI|nr:ENTH-domain-containing protein [Pseudomicrostroma glucosiphilum]PWN18304.1 ENTH-domain-containing protein [Pseudomicrostroma glucosiphilum]
MSIQNMSKSAVRVGKNYIKGYTDTQVKVRDATSNDPWGPSGTQMNELAQLSYNQNDFIEMMEIMDKRLNDKGKNWRHVFKTLTVLDYLLHAGSENVVIYFRDNMYVVKTLREFQYIDEGGKDQGANVRQKAKDITNLLQDDSRLRDERRGRTNMRDRMSGTSAPPNNDFEDEEGKRRRRMEQERRKARRDNEDDELRKAIEESKRMAREEQDRIRAESTNEDDLQRALALSREEEEKRIKELEAKNQNALFDDDWNLISNAPNQYAQPQQTGWGDPNAMYMQQQYTSYNPYFFQQQQMQAQQEAEYQRQMELQNAAQQYQQMMNQQQQMQQFQPIQPQPTAFGSNNPFAFSQPQQPQHTAQPMFQPQQPAESSVPIGDLLGGGSTPKAEVPPPQPQQQPQQQQQPLRTKITDDPRHAELNRLLAMGDGVDTFGNVGDARLGHAGRGGALIGQRTGAPLGSQPTGSNPFFRQ